MTDIAGEKCKMVFMIQNVDNTEKWENKCHASATVTCEQCRPRQDGKDQASDTCK